MKKIFIALMFSFVSIVVFGQDTITMPTIKFTPSQSYIYSSDKTFRNFTIRNFSNVPNSIIYNYDQGAACFNTGVVFISMGAFL